MSQCWSITLKKIYYSSLVDFQSHWNSHPDFFISKIRQPIETFGNVVGPNDSLQPDFPFGELNNFQKRKYRRYVINLRIMNISSYPDDPFDLKITNVTLIKDYFALFLSSIVQSSLEAGVFLESEERAFVRPKIKQRKAAEDLKPYTSLYNTSLLSKVLETARLKQLSTHLSRFYYLSCFQPAWRELCGDSFV